RSVAGGTRPLYSSLLVSASTEPQQICITLRNRFSNYETARNEGKMRERVRWGVLSTANIGVKQVIPAMQLGEWSEVTAIASRNRTRAQQVAQELGIARAYGSYDELLADNDIEAIYNPLPNHLHVPWTIKAAEAGKHVLCEKPIALNASEA